MRVIPFEFICYGPNSTLLDESIHFVQISVTTLFVNGMRKDVAKLKCDE